MIENVDEALLQQKREFKQVWNDTASLYGKPEYTAQQLRMMWDDLQEFPVRLIAEALSLHRVDRERGQYMPTVSDVCKQVYELQRKLDGYVTDEEAWMIALRASDESVSVRVTSEILEALAFVEPSLRVGDRVAARMAFKDRYNAILHDRRDKRSVAVWFVSGGVTTIGCGGRSAPALPSNDGMLALCSVVADVVNNSVSKLGAEERKRRFDDLKAIIKK